MAIIFFAITALAGFLNMSVGPAQGLTVLLVGNLILFVATLLSFFIYKKALFNLNVHIFLRALYGGMFLKMIIAMVAALVYILLAQEKVSKAGIFGCFGLYFLYTFVEVKILMRLSKQHKNA